MNATHTASLLERYGVPVFIAAAFHAVLLFAFMQPSDRRILVEVPLPPPVLPPFPPATTEPPAAIEPVADIPPVKALNPGAVRPATQDHSVHTSAEINMGPPMASPKPGVPLSLERIPPGFGDGSSGLPVAGPGGVPVFSLGQLDRTPRARLQTSPEYPLSLRQAGIEGQVLVEFSVDTTGRVVTARVVRATHRGFEAAALRAVLKWRFEPGRREGRPVSFRMMVPIGFSLAAD